MAEGWTGDSCKNPKDSEKYALRVTSADGVYVVPRLLDLAPLIGIVMSEELFSG